MREEGSQGGWVEGRGECGDGLREEGCEKEKDGSEWDGSSRKENASNRWPMTYIINVLTFRKQITLNQ